MRSLGGHNVLFVTVMPYGSFHISRIYIETSDVPCWEMDKALQLLSCCNRAQTTQISCIRNQFKDPLTGRIDHAAAVDFTQTCLESNEVQNL